MAEAFLGLKISVLLHTGLKVEGVVSHLEPSTQQMTLKDAALLFPGQPPHYTPVYGVVGKEIKDLQVLATPPKTTKTLDNHLLDNETFPQPTIEKAVMPIKSTSKNRKPRQQTASSFNNNKTPTMKRNDNEGWAREDVNIFKEEEFDFQKNLDMFDKAKEFAKIRESDETAPEELLVTLNRLPQKQPAANLLPSENVLGSERTAYHNLLNHDEGEFGDESDNYSQTPNEYPSNHHRRQSPYTATKIVTANEGIVCPTVSPLQMAHVEHECNNVSSVFEELLIENGGRGTALLVLQQVLNKGPPPSVVILAGNNKNGALGCVAARHLIHHGCSVTVCMTGTPEEEDPVILKYQEMARRFGVDITYDLVDETDLIVDAILGVDDKLVDILDTSAYEAVCHAIEWANKQAKPILSIDIPSGIDAGTGIPHHPEHMIHPKWTICLGAPKTGCKSSHITGELYLFDIGIPRLCWKRVGVKGNTIPWGADFLVALEYET